MIRVCIVDDQTLVREGIRSLLGLAGDIEVVAEASDGQEAIGAIMRSTPDVVLLDMRMPKKTGIDVLKELYRDEVTKEEWALIIELKPFFKIG